MTTFETVDAYLDAQPAEHRAALDAVRDAVLALAEAGSEAISYDMPAYRFPNGRPVYFADWKQHLSLYAIRRFDDDLEGELASFRSGKDTLQFRHRDPLPLELIERALRAAAGGP